MDVLSNDFKTPIRKDVPFIQGAWVEFWDSITVADVKKAQAMQANPTKNIDENLVLIINQVASWNFTDNGEPLPINVETFQKFSTKLLKWFSDMEAEILEESQTDKKKLPDNSSNTSTPDTQVA